MSSQNSFVNASLSSNTVSAGTTSTSAVRSRPRRLVSFIDDEDEDSSTKASNYSYRDAQPFASGLSTTLSADVGTTRSRGATPSPLSSRGTSPLPMKHPSRVTQPSNHSWVDRPSFAWNGSSKAPSPSRGAADFLDSSWSSLQSLASSVLGSDTGSNTTSNTAKGHSRRKPSKSDLYTRSIPRSTPTAWGPSAPSIIEVGSGTQEERQALVQAKKREALLLADSDPIMNGASRHKRRDSGDYMDQPLDVEPEEDALAYIHPVQATDSITGVTIKYGCQPSIFRKANGFWPNDNIQSRKTVLLPVDACSVKGRPVPPAEVDLLTLDSEDTSGSSITPAAASTGGSLSSLKAPGTADTDNNQIWKHESWVNIDGFSSAVQIGRVPRRALGFFPRTRRKSVSYTDAEPLRDDSSLEPTRTSSPVSSPQISPADGVLPRARPRTDQSKPTRPQHRRQHSNLHLTGTGVGTLDRTSTAPGPALDGLSKFFSQHMPNLVPPPVPENLRRSSFGSESTATSNASTGLENIGGAVEGWIRKVATRTKAGISELQQGSLNQQAAGRGRGLWGLGDLIELDDTSDGRRSPNVVEAPSRREAQGTSSTSSSFRVAGATASATSRSRATGLGSGSNAYGERAKDD
ncbi:Uncharacterized protein F1880_000128 [Penicillium rolfsii]|nr:Uncharacterized protein F1880_000128 [Penicillium rolfsii]